ncbi:calcium uptake protein 2, mitochondrial isoform X2 [Enhydra lutris kenyoni]|uniref:Calcium uptake protein 2, mitochondrial isoform X2 n=1 Tax=Enhydra lutris kenyoni TaxID=391180 RepID=A0A2Y9KX30_ENHLU|nr:calcium uptake protein 2, mitochondrial isoform X2 [Enhydra lutris kenyoni]
MTHFPYENGRTFIHNTGTISSSTGETTLGSVPTASLPLCRSSPPEPPSFQTTATTERRFEWPGGSRPDLARYAAARKFSSPAKRWWSRTLGWSASAKMAAAAARGAWLAAWGGRLRRGITAGRRALPGPGPGPLTAAVAGVALAGTGVAWYHGRMNVVAPEGSLTVLAQDNVVSGEMGEKLSLRKQRFMQFSSLEHEGEYYMTPRDFLFSVMFDQMERKTSVKKLTKKDIEDILAGIQPARCGSTFFRDLGDKEPHTGFHVAFKMLDADGNEMVEKKEFFKLQKIISKQDDLKTTTPNETECQMCYIHMVQTSKDSKRVCAEGSIFIPVTQFSLPESTVKEPEITTTLQIYFFGKRGERKLHYREFRRFMENLQTEVQEMEFIQFSKGLSFMRKEDFAEWLLFFTNTENKDIYWKNVREKLTAGESISLDEFKSFCHFTTHLEDFAIAMQMFSLAHRPVRLAEFKRAVKVATGQELSNNILDTVFKIFDVDGDECLSHGEFLGVLKNRMHRGLWVPQQQSVQEYWKCVKRESIKGVKEVWKQAGRNLF